MSFDSGAAPGEGEGDSEIRLIRDSLEEARGELARLRAEVAALKTRGLIAALFVAFSFLCWRTFYASSHGFLDGRRYNVIDDARQIRASLRMADDETPTLAFYDRGGVCVLSLGVRPDGSPLLMMRSPKGTKSLVLQIDDAGEPHIERR